MAVKRVESKKGESVSSLAKKAGISAKQLGWYNPKVERLKSGNLRAGQMILVPTHGTVTAAFDVPDPSIERFPKRPAPKAKSAKSGKAAGKKSAGGKASGKKPAGSKATVTKSSPKKSAAKKSPAKKSSAKKPAVKKP